MSRSVDELYATCEVEASVSRCHKVRHTHIHMISKIIMHPQVIAALSSAREAFHALLLRLEMLRTFDDMDESLRPTAVSWGMLKASTGTRMDEVK